MERLDLLVPVGPGGPTGSPGTDGSPGDDGPTGETKLGMPIMLQCLGL